VTIAHGHIPVLVDPVLRVLSPQPGETALDCTAGRGGHAAALAARLGREGTVIGVDLDAGNLAAAEARVNALGAARFIPIHASFDQAPQRLRELGLHADCVLADLGFASTQIDDAARGLSFGSDGPLDMRYDCSKGRTAAELLAVLSERELAEMIRRLGEEPLAAKIARKIVHVRRSAPIQTTLELAGLVTSVYGPRARRSRLHPATRTFMALRIAVNDELNALSRLLAEVRMVAEGKFEEGSDEGWLRVGARVAIIAFHSLEDRLVKHAFIDLAKRGLASRLTFKPVMAHDVELAMNPRARPAKLRAIGVGAIGGIGAVASPASGAGWSTEWDDEDDAEESEPQEL